MIASSDRPLVTLSITCYNHERYVKAAIEFALAQSYSPLHILISDDCSQDNSWDIIEKTVTSYDGPHKVTIRCNAKNMGAAEHINLVMGMAKGDLLVGCSADDIQMPHRVQTMVDIWCQNGKGDILIHGPVVPMNLQGKPSDTPYYPKITKNNPDATELALAFETYIGASSAFSLSLIRAFPKIKYQGTFEDLVWSFRASLKGGLVYNETPTTYYRMGDGLTTTPKDPKTKYRPEVLIQKHRIYHDALKQRLEDLAMFPDVENYANTMKKITARLEFEEAFLSLLTQTTSIRFLLSGKYSVQRLKAVYKYGRARIKNFMRK